MNKFPRVKRISSRSGFVLDLVFANGELGRVDFLPVFTGRPGLLGELANVSEFDKVELVDGVLTWPNGVDLDPLVVYCRATGHKISEFIPGADDAILTERQPAKP